LIGVEKIFDQIEIFLTKRKGIGTEHVECYSTFSPFSTHFLSILIMEDLGKRIRFHRLKQALTLQQLSTKTKLSVSFLSEIERGLAEPSMASLRKIRRALDISLLTFREETENAKPNNGNFRIPGEEIQNREKYITDARVVRSWQRKKLSYPGQPGFYELLTPDLNRQLEVLYFKMGPGFDVGHERFVDPRGEKFMYVFSGCLNFNVNGKEFHLNAGDSLSYPADAPVSWKIESDQVCEGILVITPPGF